MFFCVKHARTKKMIRIMLITIVCIMCLYLIAYTLEYSVIGTVSQVDSIGFVVLKANPPCTYFMFTRLLRDGGGLLYTGNVMALLPEPENISVGEKMYILYLRNGYLFTVKSQSSGFPFVCSIVDQAEIFARREWVSSGVILD